MSKSLYYPIIDNGMGLSRTSWAFSMLMAGLTVLRKYKVSPQAISFPYPDGAMNIATFEFLESGCERMVVIDTDVVFTPNDLEMLLEHDEPLVFGLYPKKQPGLIFPVIPLEGDETPFANDGRPDLREVACCARGFMSVHRSVFELMKPHCVLETNDQTSCDNYAFWTKLPGAHSEDFAFCNLYRKLGGKVLVDRRICCRHDGHVSYPIPGTYTEVAA